MAKKDARRGKRRVRLTPVSTYHYFRLVYRSVLLLAVLVFYIRYRLNMGGSGAEITKLLEGRPVVLGILWLVFAVEMVLRFFPARLESPGSQKQFAGNYIRTGETNIQIPDNNGTMLVALIWICFNAVFGALHMCGIFDDGIMINLHPVFLSLSELVHEKQVLQFLPHLQLGLRHDFYAHVFCPQDLFMDPAGHVPHPDAPLGDHILPASGKVLASDKRLSALRELHGETLCTQETAPQPLEGNRTIHRKAP